MRELVINGYIASEAWYSDEISPEQLHDMLYEPGTDSNEEVHITLNSYGGDCNAATRMHDELCQYPGAVNITISGTAASAATVLVQAADYLEMTSGSLFMIHDPSVMAFGNERELGEAINLLKACKQSILNVYDKRCRIPRNIISDKMSATTWMDAQEAVEYGFVDAVTEAKPDKAGIMFNAVTADKATAEKLVDAWHNRRMKHETAAQDNSNAGGVSTENETKTEEETIIESTQEEQTSVGNNVSVSEEINTVLDTEDTIVEAEKTEVAEETVTDEHRVSVKALEQRLALLNIQNI